MPPPGSPWTVLITAVAALLGVVLGQLLQGRRDTKRDRQAWFREDRHRFANEKRGFYAEFIANTNKLILAMRYVASLAEEEFERREREGKGPITDLRRWLRDVRLDRDLADPLERLGELLSILRLLAPDNIAEKAEEVYDALWFAESQLTNEQKIQDSRETVDKAVDRAIELREAMRTDLGVKQGHP